MHNPHLFPTEPINTLYKEIAQTYNYIKIKRLVSRQAYL